MIGFFRRILWSIQRRGDYVKEFWLLTKFSKSMILLIFKEWLTAKELSLLDISVTSMWRSRFLAAINGLPIVCNEFPTGRKFSWMNSRGIVASLLRLEFDSNTLINAAKLGYCSGAVVNITICLAKMIKIKETKGLVVIDEPLIKFYNATRGSNVRLQLEFTNVLEFSSQFNPYMRSSMVDVLDSLTITVKNLMVKEETLNALFALNWKSLQFNCLDFVYSGKEKKLMINSSNKTTDWQIKWLEKCNFPTLRDVRCYQKDCQDWILERHAGTVVRMGMYRYSDKILTCSLVTNIVIMEYMPLYDTIVCAMLESLQFLEFINLSGNGFCFHANLGILNIADHRRLGNFPINTLKRIGAQVFQLTVTSCHLYDAYLPLSLCGSLRALTLQEVTLSEELLDVFLHYGKWLTSVCMDSCILPSSERALLALLKKGKMLSRIRFRTSAAILHKEAYFTALLACKQRLIEYALETENVSEAEHAAFLQGNTVLREWYIKSSLVEEEEAAATAATAAAAT